MRKKQFSVLLIVFAFLSVASFSVIFYAKADIKSGPSYLNKKWDVEKMDGCKHADVLSLEGVEFDPAHSPWWVPVIDDYYGYWYWQEFQNIYNGTYGNIWIGMTAYDWYVDNGEPGYSPDDVWFFGYPWTPVGIPEYLPAGYVDYITGADLLEVLSEFDNNIHNTVVEYFGEYINDPAIRPGPYGDGKVQILVFNIRDEFFYSPDTAPGFIEGYFWSEIAAWGANAFHMDSYQWWRRQGEYPPMEDPYNGWDFSYLSIKAWEYEGTFAHEFQHLINNDVDPDELSWVDEGCSTLAEWICGYGFSPGHISEYLLWFWDTPLTIWEGYLADYGASFLWTFYMYEHYGGAPLIWDFTHEQANGIEGWVNVLAARGIKRTFDQIFQDWCIANYLDDPTFAHGRYGYYALDIPSENSEWLDIPTAMELWASWYPTLFLWHVSEYPHEGSWYPLYATRGLPYTASYVEFSDAPLLFEVEFDGDDFCGAAPTSGSWNWYSDGVAWSWFRLGHVFDLTTVTEATLTFSNYFSIEADWDYGYVEVHDLDTDEWTTLPGLLTTNTLAFTQDNPNVPDTEWEPMNYSAAGKWNAFTGDSGIIYPEVMDLTPFAGHTIELFFTYWTDGYTLGSGWYIDDIEIPEIEYLSDVETEDPTWTVNAGWYRNDEIVYNNFEVSFIKTTTITKKNGDPWITWHHIERMKLDDDTETGDEFLLMINRRRVQTTTVMVVANQPGYEHTFGTDYSFTADKWHWRCHW